MFVLMRHPTPRLPEETPPPVKKQPRRGTTLMEYLMMVSLIITVCLVGVGYFAGENGKLFNSSSTKINNSLKTKKTSSSGSINTAGPVSATGTFTSKSKEKSTNERENETP
jgi:hypothetical protein